MKRSPRWILLVLLAAVLSVTVGVVASSGKSGRSEGTTSAGGSGGHGGGHGGRNGIVYTIPGAAVFPEGIALDKRGPGKTFYVGSKADGTIFRGTTKSTTLAPFAAPGVDG